MFQLTDPDTVTSRTTNPSDQIAAARHSRRLGTVALPISPSKGGRASPRAAMRSTGTRCSNQLPATPSPHEPRTHPTKSQPNDIRGDWGQSPSPSPRAWEGERPREPRCGLPALDVPTILPRIIFCENILCYFRAEAQGRRGLKQ